MKQFLLMICIFLIASCATKKPEPVIDEQPVGVVVEAEKGPFLPNGVTFKYSSRGRILDFMPKNIFRFRSSVLPENVKESFEIVKQVLDNNKDSKIILEAHTSNTGKAYPFNYKLSQKRAANGKKFFIERNIQKDRIIEYGLGEAVNEYETQKELRRFEFIFIENDDDLNKYNDFLKTLDFKKEAK